MNMVQSLLGLACMFIAGVALWGWGCAARRLIRAPSYPGAVDIAVGMAAVIFLGGILNALKMAHGPALDAMIILGVGFSVFEWVQTGGRRRRLTVADGIAALPIAAVAVFLALYLMPPAAFNWHDDLERYFSYPVRMLATGTLAGNSLGYLGADTLGAQALLQAFVSAHLPIAYMGAVDLVFSLLLCMFTVAFAFRPERWAVWAVVAQLLVIGINPYVANVSSTYTSALLIIGLVLLSHSVQEKNWRGQILVGLLYAGLLALKTTNLVFVGLHLCYYLISGLGSAQGRTAFWRTMLALAGGTCAFMLPWLVIHASHMVGALGNLRMETMAAGKSEPSRLLSSYYTGIVIITLVLTLVVWIANRPASGEKQSMVRGLLVTVASMVTSYLCMVIWLAPLVFGEITSHRYVGPVFIGTVPAIVALSGAIMSGVIFRWMRTIALLLAVGLMLISLPTLAHRVRLLAYFGGPLQILTSDNAAMLLYVHEALADEHGARLAQIQRTIPEGEPIVVWVMTPFWLDFCRNPIFNTDPYGVAMPWTNMPRAKYFMWEYSGAAVRGEQRYHEMMADTGASERHAGFRALAFLNELKASVGAGEVVYNNGYIVVWRTRE